MQITRLISIVKVEYAKISMKYTKTCEESMCSECDPCRGNAATCSECYPCRGNATQAFKCDPCRGNAAKCSECNPCRGNATQPLKWDPCRGNDTEMFKRHFLSTKSGFSVQNASIVAQIASEPSECKILQKSD